MTVRETRNRLNREVQEAKGVVSRAVEPHKPAHGPEGKRIVIVGFLHGSLGRIAGQTV